MCVLRAQAICVLGAVLPPPRKARGASAKGANGHAAPNGAAPTPASRRKKA
jgi:hypothetical protein